jgi:hypothetical protein
MSAPGEMPRSRGLSEFMESRLSGSVGVEMNKRTKGWVYTSGRYKGKSPEQAQEEIRREWASMGDMGRRGWEQRAYGTQGPMEREAGRAVAPVAAVAAPAAGDAVETPPAPAVDNRPTDEKVRSRPEVAAAYEAKSPGFAARTGGKKAAEPVIALPRARQVDDGAARVPARVEVRPPVRDFRGEALAKMPAPDGRRVMGDGEAGAVGKATGVRVNPLTGLPFGHRVGEALPAGSDESMLARADASVMRQRKATAAAAPKPAIAADLRPSPEAVRAERAAAAQKFNAYSERPTTGPVTMADAAAAQKGWEARRTAGGPVTMGDLETAAGGGAVSEAAKWGMRPDGGQMTRDDLKNPANVRVPGVTPPPAVAAVRRRKPVGMRPIAFGR